MTLITSPSGSPEDFQLYNPEIPHDRAGHDGAHRMLQALKDLMPGGKVEVLDMVEEGDRVAARMQILRNGGWAVGLSLHSRDLPLCRQPDRRRLGDRV